MEYINHIFVDSLGIAQAHVMEGLAWRKKTAVEKEKGGGKNY
jgi:hypothetical protein